MVVLLYAEKLICAGIGVWNYNIPVSVSYMFSYFFYEDNIYIYRFSLLEPYWYLIRNRQINYSFGLRNNFVIAS